MTAEDENPKKEIHVHGNVEKITTIGTVSGNVLIVSDEFAQELGAEEGAPSVPDDIKELFDKGWAFRDAGKYEDARTKFQEALALSVEREHAVAEAKSKWYLAILLYEWDKNPTAAKVIFQECVGVFQSNKLRDDIAATLFHLGVIELEAGNLDQAEAYISKYLEIEKRLGKKLRIASALHQLGWIEDHRGHSKAAIDFYDQAMTSFLSVYQENNAETEREAIQGIAASYHHKGLVFEHDGKPEDAEINFVGALEWQRKAGVQINIGRILFLLARFKYGQNQYDIGTQFLDEATEIYKQIGDSIRYAQCLDLKGRLYFTRGQTDKAIILFRSALDAVKASGNYREVEIYLDKLGNVYLEAKKFKEARQYFEEARDLSLRENSLEGYEESVEGLARIAHLERKPEERDRLLLEGVKTLEQLLLSAQAEPKRAFALGRIGFFYEMMEKYEQALVYFQKAKRAYETLEDIGGIANSMGSIARMHGSLNRRGEEFDTYRELKKLLDGSGYYNLIAGTAINLGEIYMQIGNLDEAKLMFQEAELFCYRYNLVEYQQHLKNSINRLAEQINLRKPTQLSFEQLIAELFELIEWFPEAKDSIFRLWMWGRKDDLVANYRNTSDIKFMICQDDVDTFLKIARSLHPFSFLCLQVVSTKYPGTAMDLIPFPPGKSMFFDPALSVFIQEGEGHPVMLQFLRGGIDSRYHVTSTKAQSKITGNEGFIITGWSLGLPNQAYQLILVNSANDLIAQGIFFLPYESHLASDKLANDLRFSKERDLIPIYFDSLPDSESAEIVTSKAINLPILIDGEAEHLQRQIRKVKQSLYQLSTASKESARTAFSNFIFEVEELNDNFAGKQSLHANIYILSFPSIAERVLHIALVILNSQDVV